MECAAGMKPPPFYRPTKFTPFAPARSAVLVLLQAYHGGGCWLPLRVTG
jgi:hypothetical protein